MTDRRIQSLADHLGKAALEAMVLAADESLPTEPLKAVYEGIEQAANGLDRLRTWLDAQQAVKAA